MKIYQPNQIFRSQIPTKESITQVYEKTKEILHNMVEEKQLLGACSYGSVPNKTFEINSDIDWIFLFEDHKNILNSKELKSIFELHKQNYIDFNPPITTLNYIRQKFHHLNITDEIKKQNSREVIGLDPIQTYYKYANTSDYLLAINAQFQDFNKTYFENIIYNYSIKSNLSNYIVCLETAFNACQFIRRNMLSYTQDFEQNLNQNQKIEQIYSSIFADFISPESLEFNLKIDIFKSDYLELLNKTVVGEVSMLSINNYIKFLMDQESFILESFQFCSENLEIFEKILSPKYIL